MRKEWLARIIVITLVIGALAIPARGWWARSPGIIIHARMAETGGWTPENLTVAAGQPLQLRLTSDDAMHGFAVGQSDQPAVDVIPGEVTDVTLTFDRPEGMTKLIIEPETERILGVGITGVGAGELISEGVFAIEMGATARDLAEAIHPHPTLSETLMECAENFYGHATHALGRRREPKPV